METEIKDKEVLGSFSVKIDFDGVKTKTLPSPARFFELQGIKDVEDIKNLTNWVLTGNKAPFDHLLQEKYKKFDDACDFMWYTYNEVIFKFVEQSVNY